MSDPVQNLRLSAEPAVSLELTPQEARASRERQQAQMYLENLAKRGLVKPPEPSAAQQQQTLAQAALTVAAVPKPAGRTYTLQEVYAGWQRDPATFSPEQHAEVCEAGSILVGQGNDLETLACPRCQAQLRAADLRLKLIAAGVDGRYLDSDWEHLEQPAPLDRLATACADIAGVIEDGESLLLWSENTGSGKTQGALLAAKAAIQAGYTAQVVNIARLAVDIRDAYSDRTGTGLKESVARRLMTSPNLLVIDDLGAGESDSASVERRLLFLALDERQTYRRPTIITSNLNPRELTELFGARIMARLSPLTIIHVDHGQNFRLNRKSKRRW